MAYDLTIHTDTLKREGLRSSDFAKNPKLINEVILNSLLKRAVITGTNGFKALPLHVGQVGKSKTYKLANLDDELVLRIIAKNIKRLTGVRQGNRVSIIRSLKNLLEEGVEYRVYKLDIKSFYESIDIDAFLENLRRDTGFSKSLLSTLYSFFEMAAKNGIRGLPRGMAISATISEYVLRDFDQEINKKEDCFYYSRFVDDMVLVTSANEDPSAFLSSISGSLPIGLSLNEKKSRFLTFNEDPVSKKNPACVFNTFDFLGYKFEVNRRDRGGTRNLFCREVVADIAESKVKRLKTRIVLSMRQFCRDKDFNDLRDRLKILAGNYTVFDNARGVRRKAGIYFNYRIVDAEKSKSLIELDTFLRQIILSKSGRLCSQLTPLLSDNQRRELLQASFRSGFKKKTFHHFNGQQLSDLMKCWAHG